MCDQYTDSKTLLDSNILSLNGRYYENYINSFIGLRPNISNQTLKTNFESDWSLSKEIQGAVQRGALEPLQTVGVIPVGRDALLFNQSIAHKSFVQASAHLLAQHEWPYLVVPVEESSILVEGKCEEKLQAILKKPFFHNSDFS